MVLLEAYKAASTIVFRTLLMLGLWTVTSKSIDIIPPPVPLAPPSPPLPPLPPPLEREEVYFLQEFDATTAQEAIKLAIVTKWRDQELTHCKFYLRQDIISDLLKTAKDQRIQRADDDATQGLLDICFRLWEVSETAGANAPPPEDTYSDQNLRHRFVDDQFFGHYAKDDSFSYREKEDESLDGNVTADDGTERDEIPDLHRADSFFESGLDPVEMRDALKMLDASKGHPNSTGGLFGANNLIYPGTKWCGPGKIAKNFDDLGYFRNTDECCRTHDQCKERIAPGESLYGLKNTSPFFKLSCSCDDEFYDCLSASDSHTSNIIGNLYFDIFKRDCFAFDYPPKYRCITHETFLRIVCDAYEKNTDTSKIYYWKAAKEYKRIPFHQLYTEILSHYKHFNHFSLFKVTN